MGRSAGALRVCLGAQSRKLWRPLAPAEGWPPCILSGAAPLAGEGRRAGHEGRAHQKQGYAVAHPGQREEGEAKVPSHHDGRQPAARKGRRSSRGQACPASLPTLPAAPSAGLLNIRAAAPDRLAVAHVRREEANHHQVDDARDHRDLQCMALACAASRALWACCLGGPPSPASCARSTLPR